MTSRAERENLVAEAERVIRAGSPSFRFASQLFDQSTRERVWLLYAWCRVCDDMADGQTLGHDAVPPEDPKARVALARRLTRSALDGIPVGIAAFDGLAVVAGECGIPPVYFDDHLEGFALDADGWRPEDEADLLRYCYHVAGAVGCMMAVVMGVPSDEAETLSRAADLGKAFQLANVARDIVEDHRVGRIYLPRVWLREAGLDEAQLSDPARRPQLAALAARLGALAETYEESARIGARRLPPRSRWAVLAAANIYGDIARRVVERGAEAWDSRTVIDKKAKLRHVVRALRETLS